MSKVKTVTTAFNAGELSPKVYGRIDLQQYYNGCKSLLNTIVYPQGGCSKRYGFELISTLGVDGYIPETQVRVEEFVFNRQETFVVVFSGDNSIRVIDCNSRALVANFPSSYSGDRVGQISVYQSQDTMIITHPEVAPMQIIRDRSDPDNVVWRFTPIELKNIPEHDFTGASKAKWGTATMKFDQFKPYSHGGPTDVFTLEYKGHSHVISYAVRVQWYNDTPGDEYAEDMCNAINAALTDYTATPVYHEVRIQYWNPTTNRPAYRYVQKLSYVNLVAKDGGGDAIKVINVPSGATLTITPGNEEAIPVKEPVWSDTRGWPATVAIHQGRLWFGGSKSRPQTLWGSRSGNYFDFGVTDPDNLLANDALDLTLNDTKSNLIVGLVSQKVLMVFTNGGVFTIDGESNLITPTTVFALKQSEFGSKYATPVQMDNSVMYLQSQGAQLNSIVYSYASDSWLSNPQALLSDHLLKDPRSMCVVGAADDYNSNYMFVCNGDGTLAMFNRLEAQETSTWTPVATDGFISSACGVYDEMWCVVRRSDASGVPLYTLERYAENNAYMDAYLTVSAGEGNTMTQIYPENRGMFKGKDLVAVADGYPIKVKCDIDNFVKLPFAARNVVLGLPYMMEIETMPFAIDLQSGSTRFARKRVMQVTLDMVDSLGFDVCYAGRKYQIADRRMGFRLKEPPKPMSEVKDVRLLGYNQEGNIKITSDEPVPVSLRSVQTEVVVTG